MTALKGSVKLTGLSPQIVVALIVASSIAEDMGLDLVVTSANDSKHGANSLHYKGAAIDLRTKNMPDPQRGQFVLKVRGCLTPDFDVVFEGEGTDNEHLHVEFDPK